MKPINSLVRRIKKLPFIIYSITVNLILIIYIIFSKKPVPAYLTFNKVLETISDGTEDLRHSVSNVTYLSELIPRPNSIFFVETSSRLNLGTKESCAIESAARYHLNNQIYVIFTSPIVQLKHKSDPLLKIIQSYDNVHMKYLNIGSFVQDTPLRDLWNDSSIQSSNYLVSHLSDVFRFLLLHRFGGTYLDSDVVLRA